MDPSSSIMCPLDSFTLLVLLPVFAQRFQARRAEYNYDFEYHGERVILGTNVNQCTADGGAVCDPDSINADSPLVNTRPVYDYPFPSQNTFFWTDAGCTQLVKVRKDGMM